MTFADRLAAIRTGMADAGLSVLVAVHDGAHFIETPNPVTVLTGFKALGPSAGILDAGGEVTLIVVPAWDAPRAARAAPAARIVGADDVMEAVATALGQSRAGASIGVAGREALPWRMARRLDVGLPHAKPADAVVFGAARRKTDDEIAWAREATRIAELAYRRLIERARPGVSEDELAVELTWYTRSLGAEDNFLLLCAGPHNKAVAPSNGRRLQPGDIVLAEITPSYRGQLAQICRTLVIGVASVELKAKYELVVHAMHEGIRAAVPGVPMANVCRAINTVLEAEGYGEFCYPPHIRRRGHGLGFACNEPGDVALDNDTVLETGMVFMIHPNQYLPETGYLLCGEPVVMAPLGATPLTAQTAALAELR